MDKKPKNLKFIVPQKIPPCRLDVYVFQQGVGLSRTQIKRLITDGHIYVVGKGGKPGFILRGGEVIECNIPPEEKLILVPEEIPLNIMFEDDHIIVVNKPPGMVTHPARGHKSGTLANAIVAHSTRISSIGGDTRPGIVHRLDKDTSGLIVVAKTEQAHIKLADAVSNREIERLYLALMWGHLNEDEVVVEANIGYRPDNPTVRDVVDGGKPAKTLFRRVVSFDFAELVEAKLFTGRTHQIRVHAKYIGHPVFGDPDYGGRESRISGIDPKYRQDAKKALEIANRQLLHAYKLSFTHPIDGKFLEFFAPLPNDFLETIEFICEGDIPAVVQHLVKI